MSTLQSVIVRDVIASRPAASIPGRLFFATDTGAAYRDNGSSWDALTVSDSTKVPTSRTISTTSPLTGGGDLSADRTLAISNFTGDSGSGGATGAVPAPASGDAAAGKFLKADGTWAAPSTGFTSPLTTKGDLHGHTTTDARIPVGSDGQVLTADSTQALGVKWAAAASVTQPFLIACQVRGKPDAGFVFAFEIPSNLSSVAYPANMSGSVGKCDSGGNPTATSTWNIYDNGTQIGTMVISTSGTFTFTSTSGAAGTVAAGHEVTVVAPTPQDATLSGVRFTLAWTR